VFWVPGLVFWVPGLVFWLPGRVLWVLDLYPGCLNLYVWVPGLVFWVPGLVCLGAWTCMSGCLDLYSGCLNLYSGCLGQHDALTLTLIIYQPTRLNNHCRRLAPRYELRCCGRASLLWEGEKSQRLLRAFGELTLRQRWRL